MIREIICAKVRRRKTPRQGLDNPRRGELAMQGIAGWSTGENGHPRFRQCQTF